MVHLYLFISLLFISCSTQGIIWDAREWIWVGHVQEKLYYCSEPYTFHFYYNKIILCANVFFMLAKLLNKDNNITFTIESTQLVVKRTAIGFNRLSIKSKIIKSNLACIAFNFSLSLFLFFQFSFPLHQIFYMIWIFIHFQKFYDE